MASTHHYAILRVVPDPTRGERVNVGIVVFLEDRMDIRISPSLHKVRVLDPRVDIDNLYNLPATLNEAVAPDSSVEERHRFLRSIGLVELTELGWFRVDQHDDYEKQIERIINNVVKTPSRPRTNIPRATRLETSVKNMFKARGLLGKSLSDIENHQVVYKYPVDLDENLYADFALRNGHWHITETLDLRGDAKKKKTDKLKLTALKAITLDRAMKKLEGTPVPLVVYAADADAEDAISPHINLISDYTERAYNFLDPKDLSDYFDRMIRVAGLENEI